MDEAKIGVNCPSEMQREGEDNVLRVNCSKCNYPPSIEDNAFCMASMVERLIENSDATKIVLSQKRDFEYDYNQVEMLLEIAKIYNEIVRQKNLISYHYLSSFNPNCNKCVTRWYNELHDIVYNLIKSDPLGAYVQLTRMIRRERINQDKTNSTECINCEEKLIGLLTYLKDSLEKTKLVALAKPYLSGYILGNRDVYRKIFSPTIKPDFMFTKLMASYPQNAEELDTYMVGDNTEITIFALNDSIQKLYHMTPPEFKLSEEKYDLLDAARKIIAEHKPSKSEFVDPERMRRVFYNVGHDLIEELAAYQSMKLRTKEIDELTDILVRYTVGFGLIEVLLQDDKIQDVTINSPMGQSPVFIVHQDFDDCMTNIIPTLSEAESWASKLRMMSGRPLDEANPILDTEITLPGANARVAVISEPLNPSGLAYAFRRHRDKPWTLPLFINTRMINPLAAGLISFLVDGSRTMLVAGTRSAGKTSLLGSVMTEIMRKLRIITIEDTLELPVRPLKQIGYNIQSMKVASAMTKGTSEVAADEGIRTTLRLGDSCLIVGEVRSTEARALYEAMRVGALANVVAGTIHGDSPYGVFDRVVNDLEVPKTSFKATDIIIVANPLKSADQLHRWRRVTQITEVRKFWNDDPLSENGFSDLMKYQAKTDQLEPTDDLINGDSDVLKAIAGNVKEWAGNWDAVWDNILLRAKTKELIVQYANKLKIPELMEAQHVVVANDQFHRICDEIKNEVGSIDSKRVIVKWESWLKHYIKTNFAKQLARE
ncbi:MAG: type II/IV secretion system ATPase subunit [Candidatus Woesearchaeota archaeon]